MTRFLPPLYWGAMAAILLWDIQLAGRIAQNRRAPRAIALLSGLAGLLILPAVITAGAAPSVYSGRVVQAITWLWPVVNALVVLQVASALARRHVTPAVGIPFLIHDLMLLGVSVARQQVMDGGTTAAWLSGLGAAHVGSLGILLGPAALYSPLALQIPLLAPVTPARWRVSAALRAGLAMYAAAWTGLVGLVEYPRAVRAVEAFAHYDNARLQERPAGDFRVGLQLFPTLTRPPAPQMVANDIALADTLGVDAVSVAVAPEGAKQGMLDSLARVLEEARRDSTILVVALGYPADAREAYRADPVRYTEARMLELRRILRTLRPDIVIPAVDPYGEGARAIGRLPLDAWQRYLGTAARVVEEVRPRTQLAVAVSSFDTADSALYSWAADRGSPIEVVGLSIFPSFDGGLSLAARLDAAERWMDVAFSAGPGRPPKPHWVVRAGSYPLAFGEAAQREALWGTFAWATSRPEMRGLVLVDAADYSRVTGLRVTNGRLRSAVPALARGVRLLRETAQ